MTPGRVWSEVSVLKTKFCFEIRSSLNAVGVIPISSPFSIEHNISLITCRRVSTLRGFALGHDHQHLGKPVISEFDSAV